MKSAVKAALALMTAIGTHPLYAQESESLAPGDDRSNKSRLAALRLK